VVLGSFKWITLELETSWLVLTGSWLWHVVNLALHVVGVDMSCASVFDFFTTDFFSSRPFMILLFDSIMTLSTSEGQTSTFFSMDSWAKVSAGCSTTS
jgi:hypothetical protein